MKNWLLIFLISLISHSVNAQTEVDTDIRRLILIDDITSLNSSLPESDYAKSLVIKGKLALIAPDKYTTQFLSTLPKTKNEALKYYQVTSIILNDEILEENEVFSKFQKFLSIENLTTLPSDSVSILKGILNFMLASSKYAWFDEFIEPVDSMILKFPDSFFEVLGTYELVQQNELLCPIIELSTSTLIGEIKNSLSKEQLELFVCKY